jgi:hypothetical protein
MAKYEKHAKSTIRRLADVVQGLRDVIRLQQVEIALLKQAYGNERAISGIQGERLRQRAYERSVN